MISVGTTTVALQNIKCGPSGGFNGAHTQGEASNKRQGRVGNWK